MALYDAVSDLALEIDSYELERLEYVISPEFTRVTTVVHLRGAGEEGIGEDARLVFVTHEAKESAVQSTVHGLRELDVVRHVGGLLRVIGG